MRESSCFRPHLCRVGVEKEEVERDRKEREKRTEGGTARWGESDKA